MSPEAAEAVKVQMERYIKERQSLYSDALDAKVLREQQTMGEMPATQ